jgi:hypothetical protein
LGKEGTEKLKKAIPKMSKSLKSTEVKAADFQMTPANSYNGSKKNIKEFTPN